MSLAQAVYDENAIRKLVIGFCLGLDLRYDLTARRFPELGWRFTTYRLTPMFRRGDQGIWGLVGSKI